MRQVGPKKDKASGRLRFGGALGWPVWNLKTSSTATFETLQLNYDAKPPFSISYGK
jgi:hypothetical protein